MPDIGLSQSHSECGPWTHSVSITWDLVRHVDNQASAQFCQSNTLQVCPRHLCFNKPSKWLKFEQCRSNGF